MPGRGRKAVGRGAAHRVRQLVGGAHPARHAHGKGADHRVARAHGVHDLDFGRAPAEEPLVAGHDGAIAAQRDDYLGNPVLVQLLRGGVNLVDRLDGAAQNLANLVGIGLDHGGQRLDAAHQKLARGVQDAGLARCLHAANQVHVSVLCHARRHAAVEGHNVCDLRNLADLLANSGHIGGRDLAARLQKLGRDALLVKHVDAAAGLARDLNKVVLDAVGIKQVAQQTAVVAAHKAGRQDLLATGRDGACGVQALAAGVVDAGGDTHHGAVHQRARQLIGLVDGRVERDGRDHDASCICEKNTVVASTITPLTWYFSRPFLLTFYWQPHFAFSFFLQVTGAKRLISPACTPTPSLAKANREAKQIRLVGLLHQNLNQSHANIATKPQLEALFTQPL